MTTIKKRAALAENEAAPESIASEVAETVEAIEGVKVEHDEQAGTAKFSLVNGTIITLKEPKAKNFIYLSSRMETAPAWQRSATMACYLLAHFMISEMSIQGKVITPIPDFDGFMDMLEDDDLERVGAAFACFPTVLKRVAKLFNRVDGAGA